MRPLQSLKRSAGFSLVEVMVALVIGMVVIAAVLATYLGSSQAGREQAAYAELNENAQLAFDILTRDLLMAGYVWPTGLGSTGKLVRPVLDRPIFGCDQGFISVTQSTPTCSTAPGKPALRVIYQADLVNTVPTSDGEPSDCLGNGINAAGGTALADNRYYLKEKVDGSGRFELYCAAYATGSGASGGQPLVDNVAEMHIHYGQAATANPGSVVRYVSASDLHTENDWSLVVNVRICLLMRSNEPVLSGDGMLSYRDCASNPQTSTDRHVRRAYATTVTLRNRMAL
ncbi:PilW family protein [Malikia sp.]|uniref:PilW family protein n=1 Tax=Malikia sp. TaxID=2070706 RepID=UPI002603F787|nr:PilW family protein [Malikia sp.]MDD2729221.1 PilW family protein [Malikia sp.]